MSLRTAIRTPFYEGTGTSALVPYTWDAAVNGTPFMFDTRYFGTDQFKRSSISLLKPQQATGSVNEDALNPADGIRAKVESWHHGAGQVYLDRPESDEYRFRTSKGIDPWTRWKASMQWDTAQRVSSSNTNVLLQPAGSRLYFSDGQALKYVTAITASPTVTTVTGTPAATVTSITSDGFTVWAAHTASGLYKTDTSTGAASQLVTTALAADSVVGYVKGRLMLSKGNVLYNITDLAGPAAVPSALFTHPNTSFVWVGFAEGQSVLYAAGHSGDKSLIYKTSIKADGTGLDIPTVAGELPDGEIVRSIGAYLGLILIGTDKGVWVAAQDSSGNLTINKVLVTSAAVKCFEGQDDFVWFGWSNYDATSTGLGRMDLRSDTKGADVVTPAYASDLMATAQGAVLSVVTFADSRVFSVSGSGVWAQTTDKVASAVIDGGLITHGMPDDKVALAITVTHEALAGQVAVALSTDSGPFETRGSSVTADSTSTTLSAGSATGETFEIRHTLTRSSVDTTEGPVLTRSTLESNPAPGRGEFFTVAFLFYEKVLVGAKEEPFDPIAAYEMLVALESSGVPAAYQDPLGAATVTLEDHHFVIEDFTEHRNGFVGTFIAKFRRPRTRS